MSRYPSSLSLILWLVAISIASAQITIEADDLAQIGDSWTDRVIQSPTGVAAFTAASSGGPETWDFEALLSTAPTPPPTRNFSCVETTDGAHDGQLIFPNSQRAVRVDGIPGPTWLYDAVVSGERRVYGSYDDFVFGEFIFDPYDIEIVLPLELGASWGASSTLSFLGNMNSVETTGVVDAWGTAILPGLGSVECLRVRVEPKTHRVR